MNTKRLTILTSISGLITVAAASGYLIGRARASGIPATNAMTYSGVLTDTAGAPLSGSKTIAVTLWDAVTAGTSACVVPGSAQPLVAGGFQVQLNDACTTAVHANPNLWAEVIVDGLTLGRTKLGAVPYAVDADHAVETDHAKSADSAVTVAFQGFSAHNSAQFTKLAGWKQVVLDTAEFNTFGTAYNAATGTFTAPKAGYYRFSATGHSNTATPGNDTRVGVSFYKNSVTQGLSGCQLSTADSPLPAHVQILKLSAQDAVQLWMYTPVDIVIAIPNGNTGIRFQAEYIGPSGDRSSFGLRRTS